MYRSLLITSVDDSVSAVAAGLGTGFTGFTESPAHLPEYREHSFEEASVLRKRTKLRVKSSLRVMVSFL
jgi:hypothetical protein